MLRVREVDRQDAYIFNTLEPFLVMTMEIGGHPHIPFLPPSTCAVFLLIAYTYAFVHILDTVIIRIVSQVSFVLYHDSINSLIPACAASLRSLPSDFPRSVLYNVRPLSLSLRDHHKPPLRPNK